MTVFKYRDDPVAASLLYAAVAIVLATGGVLLLVPKPTTVGLAAQADKKVLSIRTDGKKAEQSLADAQTAISKLTWSGPAQDVAGAAMARVSDFAAKHRLKLDAFRPQRSDPKLNPPQMPFLVTIEGHFTDVVGFTREFDDSKNKLAVSQIQMSASEDGTDAVTANVDLVAYLSPVIQVKKNA